MGKLLGIVLLGVGVYLGVTFHDEISSVFEQTPLEKVESQWDSLKDNLEDEAESLKDKLDF